MLNVKQRKFIVEYLKFSDAGKAAEAAGYSKKTAYSAGPRLLKNPQVKSAIEKKLNKYEITPERVLAEIARLGYANMEDFTTLDTDGMRRLDLSKLNRDQCAAIAEISEDTTGGSGDGERKAVLRTKIKLWDKTKALEMLGKHLKLFTDKVEHSADESLAALLAFKQRFDNANNPR